MFYKVKVFDSQGRLKKVLSSKKLSNRFWRNTDSALSYSEDGFTKSEEWSVKGDIKTEKVTLNSSL